MIPLRHGRANITGAWVRTVTDAAACLQEKVVMRRLCALQQKAVNLFVAMQESWQKGVKSVSISSICLIPASLGAIRAKIRGFRRPTL